MKENTGFFQAVYDVVKKIPKGKVVTYGQIACALNMPRMSRQVGWALHQNPKFMEIPCHRVVNRFGEICSGFAFGGSEVQKNLLLSEGVEFINENQVDLSRFQHKFL